jgi:hypothetical protein
MLKGEEGAAHANPSFPARCRGEWICVLAIRAGETTPSSHRQWFALYYTRSIPLTNPRWVEAAGLLA